MSLPLIAVGLGVAVIATACKSDVKYVDLKSPGENPEGEDDIDQLSDTGFNSNNKTVQAYAVAKSHVGQTRDGAYIDPLRNPTYGVPNASAGEIFVTNDDGYTFKLKGNNYGRISNLNLFGNNDQSFPINILHDFIDWSESDDDEFTPAEHLLGTLNIDETIGSVDQAELDFTAATTSSCSMALSGTWYRGNNESSGELSICVADPISVTTLLDDINPATTDTDFVTTIDLQGLLNNVRPDRDSVESINSTVQNNTESAITLEAVQN